MQQRQMELKVNSPIILQFFYNLTNPAINVARKSQYEGELRLSSKK